MAYFIPKMMSLIHAQFTVMSEPQNKASHRMTIKPQNRQPNHSPKTAQPPVIGGFERSHIMTSAMSHRTVILSSFEEYLASEDDSPEVRVSAGQHFPGHAIGQHVVIVRSGGRFGAALGLGDERFQ
jgi:hypothetical protein